MSPGPLVGASLLLVLSVVCWAGDPAEAALEAQTEALRTAFDRDILPLLKTHCLECHGSKKQKGDVDFSRVSARSLFGYQSLVRHGLQKLITREMPPEKEPQPTDVQRQAAVTWLAALRRLTPRDPGPGTIRRLSRVEYANTLHDLLGVDPAVAADLPGDAVGAGFTSSIAPLLMEKYLLVADEVLDQLIRPGQMKLTWRAGQLDAVSEGKADLGKDDGGERQLIGPAQLTSVLPAPVDGTYTFKIRAASERIGKDPLKVAVRCGNQVVGELKITAPLKTPATYSLTCRLSAGRLPLTFIMMNPVVEPEPESAKPGNPVKPAPPGIRAPTKLPADKAAPASDQPQKRTLWIDTIEITGPPAAAPTEVQRRLFVALPGKDLDKREAARRIAEAFARRAFRRPASAAELDVLLKVFDLADAQEEVFAESIKLMLKGMLVSPQFLYIAADTSSARERRDQVVAISDHQIAAKLSYLLWSTMPDDALSALADAGTLHQPEVLAKEVRRLVADPRSRAFFDGFGAQWLGLDKLDTQPFDEKKFPLMTKDMRRAMYEEAALLFDTVLREDRSLFDLLDADFTFVNGTLAKIYGMENEVKGPQFRRVTLSDGNRGGILTLPGVLAMTSLPNRTSPVKRGKWVLEQILGQLAPTPPMNVATLEQQNTPENVSLNLRQRTERHRRDPACAGCHRVLDVIGFGLENFDVIGRWREKDDTDLAVDAAGELPGKVIFHRPQELKRIISARREEVCRALTGRMLAYALCRSLDGYDEVVADDIAAAVAKDGYKLQTLVVQIATSYPFLNRRVER
jgi:hypothetical protein